MVPLPSLWLPIVLSAVLVFVVSSVLHIQGCVFRDGVRAAFCVASRTSRDVDWLEMHKTQP